nr:MAG TPA: hypothetical protein [Caudoviricetes sp.]
MQDRLLMLIVILSIVNISIMVVNVFVTERNIRISTDKRLKEVENLEKELRNLKELLALQAFMEMTKADREKFMNDIKKEVSKDDK